MEIDGSFSAGIEAWWRQTRVSINSTSPRATRIMIGAPLSPNSRTLHNLQPEIW
jgi:hypothetical protein